MTDAHTIDDIDDRAVFRLRIRMCVGVTDSRDFQHTYLWRRFVYRRATLAPSHPRVMNARSEYADRAMSNTGPPRELRGLKSRPDEKRRLFGRRRVHGADRGMRWNRFRVGLYHLVPDANVARNRADVYIIGAAYYAQTL